MSNVTRKIQADQSAPVEIVTTFVKSQYNVSQYKTKLDPVVLMTPHSDGVSGKDIVVIDKDNNFGPTFVGQYNTAIKAVDVFTKNQLSLAMPVQIQIASGNNLMSPGSPVDPTNETNKINVTDLIGTSINTILSSLTINIMNMKTYNYCSTDSGASVWTVLLDYVSNIGGTVDLSAGRHIVYDAIAATLHIVYTKRNSGSGLNQVWHAYSSDGGKTWTSETIYSASTKDQFQPQIVIDINRMLHFVWVECFSSYETPPNISGPDTYYFYSLSYRNKDSAGNWGSVATISRDSAYPNRAGYQNHPSLQVQNDGLSLGVAWMGHGCCRVDFNIGVHILYMTRDSGGTWSSRDNVYGGTTGTTHDLWSVTLDYDLSNNPHVIFCSDYDSGPHYPAYHTTKSSGTWSAVELVSDTNLPTLATSNCVIDLDGAIHVLLISSSGYAVPADVWYAKKVLGGSWVRTKLLSSCAYYRAGLQTDVSRNFYVYCTKWNGSHYDGYAAKYSADVVKLSDRFYNAEGHDVVSVSVPWSRAPLLGSVYQHLSQQDNCIVFCRATNGPWTTGDLIFTSDSESVIGSVPIIPSYDSYNTKIRGIISRSKLNPPLICPAVIQ